MKTFMVFTGLSEPYSTPADFVFCFFLFLLTALFVLFSTWSEGFVFNAHSLRLVMMLLVRPPYQTMSCFKESSSRSR